MLKIKNKFEVWIIKLATTTVANVSFLLQLKQSYYCDGTKIYSGTVGCRCSAYLDEQIYENEKELYG